MNIVHLITMLDFGGAPRGVLELIRALDRLSHVQPQLLVLGSDTGTYSASSLLPAETKFLNYTLRHSDLVGIYRVVKQIRRILVASQIDVLHTHLPTSDFIGALACAGTTCRHLSHIRGTPSWYFSTKRGDTIRKAIYRIAFNRAKTNFVSVSQGAADHTRIGLKIPAERIQVVLNGIDGKRFPELPASVRTPDTIQIGAAGRFIVEKGYADLIEAFAALSPQFPYCHLTIAGEGDLRAKHEHQCRTLGISNRCKLIPPVEDMNRFLRDMDIFVLPSHTEGLARVILEAMYCGRAIVASEVAGTAECLTDGRTGRLYPAGDVSKLTEGLGDLIRSAPLRKQLGQAAAIDAKERFTVERVASQIMTKYSNLVGVPIESMTKESL